MQAKQKHNPVKYSANISTDHRYLLIKHGVHCRNTPTGSHSHKNIYLLSSSFFDTTPLLVCS